VFIAVALAMLRDAVGVLVPMPTLPVPNILRLNPPFVIVVFCNNVPPSCTLFPAFTVSPLFAVTSPEIDEVEIIPFTFEDSIFVEVETVNRFEEITLLVAATPFTVVVRVLPLSVVVRELIILVNNVDTPFTILANVFVVVLRVFEFTKLVLVVAMTPLVVLVKIKLLVVVERLRVLVVVEVSPESVVVEITPLMLVVKRLVVVEKVTELLEITDEVAETPFTVVVSIFPLSVVERELMMLVKSDCTPFTSVEKVFVVVLSVLEFTKLVVVVATFPFTLEVIIKLLVLVARDNVLVVVAVIKSEREVVAMIPLIFVVNNPVDVA
jgi:hypothetical protein